MGIILAIFGVVLIAAGLYAVIAGVRGFDEKMKDEMSSPHPKYHEIEVKRIKDWRSGVIIVGLVLIVGGLASFAGAGA